jgi:hypothetical protein
VGRKELPEMLDEELRPSNIIKVNNCFLSICSRVVVSDRRTSSNIKSRVLLAGVPHVVEQGEDHVRAAEVPPSPLKRAPNLEIAIL